MSTPARAAMLLLVGLAGALLVQLTIGIAGLVGLTVGVGVIYAAVRMAAKTYKE